MDEFEDELREAFAQRPAPPGLKRRLMEKHRQRRAPRPVAIWQRLAASLVLAAAVAGGFAWRNAEERRKGEEARRQVMTALRITNHALDRVNRQLAAHSRTAEE
jgi:hypothetical protein